MTPEEERERIFKEVRGKEIKTPMFKKTWAVDWEYIPGKIVRGIIKLFKKET